MTINQNLTNVNFNVGNNKQNKYIVIHYVGAVSTAYDNTKYFKNVNRSASANYFVDENEIWQCVLDKDVAWHCGGGRQGSNGGTYLGKCTNYNSIGIEMCCFMNNGLLDIKQTVIDKTIELTKYLMNKYNISSSNVIRHFDVTGKNCPAPMVVNSQRWNDFKIKLGDTVTTPSQNPNIYYRMKTREDGWLEEVKNLEDYAGYRNHEAIGICMRTDNGSLRYRITTLSGKTLGWITQCNINDYINGWAGNGETIATIEAEYFTPQSIVNQSGYKYLKYKVNDYPYQIDLIRNKAQGLDGYAGVRGVPCTKFQAYIE